MPDRSQATRESMESALLAIEMSPLARVGYYGFGLGLPNDQPTDMEWGDATDLDMDDATHHFPTMGVELTFANGATVTVCWGDAFGHFGLEVMGTEALNLFQNNPAYSDVSSHRWWAPFIGERMSAELHWATGFADSPDATPLVLRLAADDHSLWLTASDIETDGTVRLGMDGITVSPSLDPPMASIVI